MNRLNSMAGNHPVLFAVCATMGWLALLALLSGIVSSALGKPFTDVTTLTVSRLTVSACFLALLARLGWLRSAGVTRLGSWQVWLIALGGMIFFSTAFLSLALGTLTFDLSNLADLPDPLALLLPNFAVALCEEIAFRGLILHALTRAWGNTRRGLIGSVLLTSLLFAILHFMQVFANGLSLASVSLLILEGIIISIWWGALVLFGGSLWPPVLVHFVTNAVAAYLSPSIPAGFDPHRTLLLFSLPLGALAIAMLRGAPLLPAQTS